MLLVGLLQNAFPSVQDSQMRVRRWTRRPDIVAPQAERALLQHALIRRGCGIHALCLGTDGGRVTEVRSRARTAACRDPKPTRKPAFRVQTIPQRDGMSRSPSPAPAACSRW